ncbi:oligoribonuclease [Buchnera aphidicola (Mindarus keteleerifoliae)]|uniref:oligoribonuclease n=1 Tax=Buchnera aphidicola TaxID=9 RepID=UPI0031B6BDF5
MKINNTHLIWIDLEMTGLNPKKNKIIEIATLITDKDLKILSEGPVIPIHQSLKEISSMNSWNKYVHTKSGLIKRVLKSRFNEKQAEKETIKFLKKWVPINTSPICGNSVNQDRRFLFEYMPKLEKFFHYRSIDVSTLRELAIRWKPSILRNNHTSKKKHIALEDIYLSVNELDYYRKKFIQI